MNGLTAAQSKCLAFIRDYYRKNGITPSFQNMSDALAGTSKSNVHRLVVCLAERGFLTRPRDTHGRARYRGIQLVLKKEVCPHCGNPIGSNKCRKAAALEQVQ